MSLFNSIDWTAVTAIAAVAGVLIAAYLQISALHSTWLSDSANMVAKFDADRESPTYRRFRKRFCQQLLEVHKMKTEEIQDHEVLAKTGIADLPVLDLYESLAYLTHRGVLDKGMVWNKFFWEIERYYIALTEPVNILQIFQKDDPTIYCEFEWLYKSLLRYDRKQRKIPISAGKPSISEAEHYLVENSSLTIDNSDR